jgi:phosphocarrier protein
MQERNVTIINKLGLHARAAAKFVTVASTFSCDIEIEKSGQKVNGKSIMGVMMLAASRGTQLVLITCGQHEADAADALEKLIAERFGEHE